MKTILIADDHRIFREGLKSLLDSTGRFAPVVMAENGRQAIELAKQYSPDYILMDVSMPDINGIEATRMIQQLLPDCKVIALSMHVERLVIMEMIKAGAISYLLKEEAFDDLLIAIERIEKGGTYLPPRINKVLIHELRKDKVHNLTQREVQVLKLLALGHNVYQVASDLSISNKTVETHRRNIMKKLNLQNLADLTRYAIRDGLINV